MWTAWLDFPLGRFAALLAAIVTFVGFVRHLIFRATNPRDVYRKPPTGGRRPPDDGHSGRRASRRGGRGAKTPGGRGASWRDPATT